MRTAMIVTMLAATVLAVAQERTTAPAGAEVYIITPKSGEIVKGTVTVRFGLRGMGIAPAGVKLDGTGHHHLLVDADPPADLNLPLRTTERLLHFGKGQTETTLDLPAGTHTLQLLFADHNHVPHATPLLSGKITITVVK